MRPHEPSGVSKVEQSILKDHRCGKSIVLWISVPCDPWCSWHRVFTYRPGYASQLKEKRDRSRKGLKLLSGLLSRLTTKIPSSALRVCFEWPRNNDGWTLPEIASIRRYLPHTADFDGCAYGVPFRKPWRVVSNRPEIVKPLSKRCPGVGPGHEHLRPRGKVLKQSELYTPKLVRAICGSFSNVPPCRPWKARKARKMQKPWSGRPRKIRKMRDQSSWP